MLHFETHNFKTFSEGCVRLLSSHCVHSSLQGQLSDTRPSFLRLCRYHPSPFLYLFYSVYLITKITFSVLIFENHISQGRSPRCWAAWLFHPLWPSQRDFIKPRAGPYEFSFLFLLQMDFCRCCCRVHRSQHSCRSSQ